MKIMKRIIRAVKGFRNVLSENEIPEDVQNEKIPFIYLSEKLIETAKVKRDLIGKRVILPSTLILIFSPIDRASRKNVEKILMDELKEVLMNEVKKWRGVEPDTDIHIRIDTDTTLEKGEFYIDSNFDEVAAPELSEGKRFKAYPFTRDDLSRTFISDPDASQPKTGALLNTLLGPKENMKVKKIVKNLFQLSVQDTNGERTFYLSEGSYKLGRGINADIKLDINDKSLSRDHIKLEINEKGVMIKMVGKNGGKVNKGFVEAGSECLLLSGDKIYIGNSVLILSK